MSAVARVFVSATSGDLTPFRKAVAQVLQTLEILPIVQDQFAPDYRSVVEMLREKIGECDAVICLVGRCYGSEPRSREPDQPRRSYTQLEYQTALDLGKPVFVFVATDDCPLVETPPEPDELCGLQLEHLNRITSRDHIWMPFHSLGHLTDQVRVMRFDPGSLARGVTARLAVLLIAELVEFEAEHAQRGGLAWVRDVVQPFQGLLHDVLARWGGAPQSQHATEYQVNFETADAAVNAALALHGAVRRRSWPGQAPAVRIGIHMGQVVRFGGVDEGRVIQEGHALKVCRHLTDLGKAGQTFLTRVAFDDARKNVRPDTSQTEGGTGELRWESYGRYLLSGADESLEVCEVGVGGVAPLTAPADSPLARRADSLEDAQMRGLHPGLGRGVPRRPGWQIEQSLGEGGFGEVWVARHQTTRERRVFKFCFDASRLGSFKRELTLFRLLRTALGERPDIARLLDIELEKPPFYLESEYIEGGNLREWAESNGTDRAPPDGPVGHFHPSNADCDTDPPTRDAGFGRLIALPLEDRLRIVAEIAGAVTAAHSVGIIHKDLKPSNIFMRQGQDGRSHPVLADFGIGAIADRAQLEQRGITIRGFTRSALGSGSTGSGTPMYQPPEAHAGRPATVQGDVYALGVLLYQLAIGDLHQHLGHGWERQLEASRSRGFRGEFPRESERSTLLSSNLDPSGELVARFLREDIGACVDGDPAARLTSAGQLVERLQSMGERVATEVSRLRAEEAARKEAEEAGQRADCARLQAEEARLRADREAQHMWRLRVALTGTVAALVVVGLLAFFAFRGWREAAYHKKNAERARENAVAHEQRAKDKAHEAQKTQMALVRLNGIIFEIQGVAATQVGNLASQLWLLHQSLGRLETLSEQCVQHESVDRGTALALEGIADLVVVELGGRSQQQGISSVWDAGPGDPVQPGTFSEALRLYTLSNEIFQELVTVAPNDAYAKRGLSVSYRKLGDLHWRAGNTEKALDSYLKGLELGEALTKADPNNAQARGDVSISVERLGYAFRQLGNTAKAIEYHQKGLEFTEALANAEPNNPGARRDRAVLYGKLGDIHVEAGDTIRAAQSYQKCVEFGEALAESAPNNSEARRDLSVSYDKLGDVQLEAQNAVKAAESYQRCVKLREALAKTEPPDTEAMRDLVTSYDKLGDVQRQLGKTDMALESCLKELELGEMLAKADPGDAQAKRDLLVSYNRLGDLHRQMGKTDKALESYQKGLALAKESFEEALKEKPKSVVARTCLAWLLATCWEESIRDGKRAVDLATSACELSNWKDPAALDALAAACAEAGSFDDAVTWQRKSLELPVTLNDSNFARAKGRLELYEAGKPYHEPRPQSMPTAKAATKPG
jgi:serine/threonine protein kinase/Flp pilus assembly protein TadD